MPAETLTSYFNLYVSCLIIVKLLWTFIYISYNNIYIKLYQFKIFHVMLDNLQRCFLLFYVQTNVINGCFLKEN